MHFNSHKDIFAVIYEIDNVI